MLTMKITRCKKSQGGPLPILIIVHVRRMNVAKAIASVFIRIEVVIPQNVNARTVRILTTIWKLLKSESNSNKSKKIFQQDAVVRRISAKRSIVYANLRA